MLDFGGAVNSNHLCDGRKASWHSRVFFSDLSHSSYVTVSTQLFPQAMGVFEFQGHAD